MKRTAEAMAEPRPKFGEVEAGGDADGDTQQRGQQEDDARTNDGVRHTAAGFTDGCGDLGEEGEVE